MFNQDNRKFILIAGGIFVLFVIIALVFVFSSGGSKKTDQTGDGTLTIWAAEEKSKDFEKLIEDYSDKNDIKITYVKKDAGTFLTDSLAEIASGKGPDIWVVPSEYLAKYHNQMVSMPEGLIAQKKKTDVEVFESTFPEVFYEEIIDSKIYGVPLSAQPLKLFVNPNLLSEERSNLSRNNNLSESDGEIFQKGPKNWDQFVRLSNLLTKKNGSNITLSGVAMGTENINNSVDILTLLMLQYGAKMTNDDHSAALFQTSQNVFSGVNYPGTKALEFFTSFASPSSANYSWSDSLGEPLRAFSEGKLAMYLGYESEEEDIKRINSNASYEVKDIPQIKETKNPVNFANYNVLSVTKATKSPESAWNFIKYALEYSDVKKDRLDENSPLLTAKSWFVPDPVKTPEIFKEMIKQVNSGGNSQTAIENAASQVTTLLKAIKQ